MSTSTFSALPLITIDGHKLSDTLTPLIDSLVVDDHLHLPDNASIVFRDPAREVVELAKARIGAPIRITVVSTGRGASDGTDALFDGEITGIEGDYGQGGQRIILRAYDLSYRLHRGRRTAVYPNSKDSDIAKKLAAAAGLKIGDVPDSGVVREYVSQINLTDWEFLKARAREIGFEAGVIDGTFHFKPAKVNQNAPGPGTFDSPGALQMVFGADLLEFRPRVSGVGQVHEVVARGWSPQDKREVVGRTDTTTCNSAPKIPITPASVISDRSRVFHVPEGVLSTQKEADDAAAGAAHQISGSLAEADGVARGNPKLTAGAVVSVAAVSPCFAGVWTVTSTQHRFNAGGYHTHFVVSGRQERSLLGLASGGGANRTSSAGGPPIYGVVIGLVSNIKDPQRQNRVRLTFPWLSDTYETDWVRFVVPGAGKSRGFTWLPDVGDEVLVSFERGDVRRPYVLGALFNGKDHWENAHYSDDGQVKRRGMRSGAGHTMEFHELAGKQKIVLRTGNEQLVLTLDQSNNTISIQSNGAVSVTGSSITVDASQDLTLKAGTELKLSATTVSIAADATVDIDGALITLN
jgi:phage protein D/phage baseplate assembly protein gpV